MLTRRGLFRRAAQAAVAAPAIAATLREDLPQEAEPAVPASAPERCTGSGGDVRIWAGTSATVTSPPATVYIYGPAFNR